MAADGGTVELKYRARLDQLERDMAGVKSKVSRAAGEAGDSFSTGFTRDALGRLRDERGRFVSAGGDLGQSVGRGANSALRRASDDAADGFGRRFTSKMGGIGKKAALGLAAGFAGAALGAGAILKGAFDAAEESRKVGAQTAAVIESTGGVANVSAAHVAKYADQLAALTGIDDEVIASGQNMLLTFTNVRNQVGKGNDIFDQGTKAALNMSVALGTDMNQASMLVGKALNDPIAGMTALTRSGIQFTDQQKAQIKTMVAAGDTLGAQKVILKELETQFAGSAEAAASPLARLKVVVGNLQEELGARLLPVVGKVATFLADKLPGALDKVGAAFGPVMEVVGFAKAAFASAFSGEGVTSDGYVGVFERIGVAARAVVDWFVVNWPQIKATVSEVMTTVIAVVTGAADVVMTIWNNFGSQIVSYTQNAFNAAAQIIGGAMEMIRGIVATVTAIIHGDWSAAWDGIKQVLAGAFDAIIGLAHQWDNMMRTLMSVAMEILGSIIRSAFEGIVNFIASIPGRIVGALGDLSSLLYQAGRDLIMGMVNGIKSMAGALADAAKSVASGAVNAVKGFLGIGSPSKLFMGFGVNIGEGMALGMGRSVSMVEQAGDVLAAAAGGAGSSVSGLAHYGDSTSSDSGSASARPINVGPFYVKENDLPTEIPRRLRGALHMWT